MGLIKQVFLPGILCLCLFVGHVALIGAASIEKQTVLTALTINLGRFIHWPDGVLKTKKSVINLCVIGDNVVQTSFIAMSNKRINQQSLKIINRTNQLNQLSQCQLLYVSALDGSFLLQVLTELKNKPVLTVGENIDFLKAGGMVSLERNGGKMQISINLPQLKQSGLTVNSRLLKLAKIYDFSS